MLKRNEVAEKYKWDLREYFANDEVWEQEFKNVKSLYEKLTNFEGTLNNEIHLYECLSLEKTVNEITSRLYVYISLKVKEDAKNNFYQSKANKLEKYLSDIAPRLAFIESEINELSDDFLRKLAENGKFKDYNLMLKNVIKNKPHMLSKTEEKLMSTLGECIGGASDVFDMLDAVDITFEDVTDSNGKKYPLNNANYSVYTQSDDSILRETAFINLNGGYGKLNYTISANYLNNIKTDCTLAKVRKFDSAFEESLFYEDVNPKAYELLTQMVEKNASVFHRYFKLKQKTLGLKEFYNYDVNARLKNPDSLLGTINDLESYR